MDIRIWQLSASRHRYKADHFLGGNSKLETGPRDSDAMAAPFKKLEYLYVGTSDFERDLAYYRDVLNAQLVWNRTGFGARVAAFKLGAGPMVLIADHRPAPSCIPVYAVEHLEATVRALKKRGWKSDGGRIEIPNGPGYVFEDPSKNRFAIFENVRPNVFG